MSEWCNSARPLPGLQAWLLLGAVVIRWAPSLLSSSHWVCLLHLSACHGTDEVIFSYLKPLLAMFI